MKVNQLKAGAFLSYVSIILNNVVGLLYTPFMLRMMGQNEFGLYSLVASVVGYLTILDFGFANAIIRYTAKYRAENKEREQYEMFGMFIILYCIIGVIAFIAGLFLYFNADSMFNRTMTIADLSKVRTMILLMVFNVAFTFPMSIWGAIITAYEEFVFQKIVNICRIILNPIIMVILLYMGYRAVAMVVLLTIFNVATLLMNAWYCFFRIHVKVKFGKIRFGFLKEISTYSFWIFLEAIMNTIFWSTGQFVLGIYVGASTVAIYAVAIQLKNIYLSFSTAISGVFLPRITSMVSKHTSDKEISDLFIKTGRIQYVVMITILAGFILFGRQFVRLWAGDNYDESYFITLMFFIPLTVPLIQNLGISILQAKNQLKFRSVLYVSISVASLAISIPLSIKYGGIGCAAGTTIALVVGQILIMNIYYYKKVYLDIPKFWREIFKMSIVPSILCVIGGIILHYYDINSVARLSISILIFLLVYTPLFWRFSMNEYERALLLGPIKKVINKK